MTTFDDLGLDKALLAAIEAAGYITPTPIQEKAIPLILQGRDVLGTAVTGSGKTASFTLPMIEILNSGRARARMPRSLILEPTRELAAQVDENFKKYGKNHKLTTALIMGGEKMNEQIGKLTRGVDVLIATPGRLLDLFERGHILLSDIKLLVIDECDRMLDMGFIPDIERIAGKLPRMRQTLLFSATMPSEIRKLADKFLSFPKTVSVDPPDQPATRVRQSLVRIKSTDKRIALRHLLKSEEVKSALIFCNRKRDIGILQRSLIRHGFKAGEMHGDMDQSRRTETLAAFRAGDMPLLVCSDVAARGLDIGGLSHVFNFDVPSHAEDYIHRIGRTGRAGKSGRAFTLVTPGEEDRRYLAAIEKLISKQLPADVEIPGLSGGKFAPRKNEHAKPQHARQSAPPAKPARKRPSAPPVKQQRDIPNHTGPGFGEHIPSFMRPKRRP
ncbi:MAG: DEAD/DEAH box helicase [Pseudomonadota bacterium]|nr:DEAD/DEAH box helicase [Pseudomonadota bacterium]